MKHIKKNHLFVVIFSIYITSCSGSDSGKPDNPLINRDGGISDVSGVQDTTLPDVLPRDGQKDDTSTPLSRGWVENDDGKGGKLVNVKWTWVNPLPQGNRLNDIWGNDSSKKMWAVGNHGTIMHHDGNTWKAFESNTTKNLYRVWGCADNDVYAVGSGGTILWFDGKKWQSVPSGTTEELFGVYCQKKTFDSPSKKVYAVGSFRTFLISDNGKTWKALSWVDTPDLYEDFQKEAHSLYTVWGDGTGTVYAGGNQEVFFKYDGNSFSIVPRDIRGFPEYARLLDLWGSSPQKVFVLSVLRILFHDQEKTELLKYFEKSKPLQSLWGIGPDNLITVGHEGTIFYWDETGSSDWQKISPLPQKPKYQDLFGVWGWRKDGKPKYWIVGDHGTMMEFNGQTLSATGSDSYYNLSEIWGANTEPLFALEHTRFGKSERQNEYGEYILEEKAGRVLQKTNGKWQPVSNIPAKTYRAMWGNHADNVWFVGDDGSILNYKGSSFQDKSIIVSQRLNDIWGLNSPQFIVGNKGTILKYQDNTWTSQSSGVSSNLNGIWGQSSDDVYAVGDYQTILHFDGKKWQQQLSNGIYKLHAVWGSNSKNVYAVGGSSIFHYDGQNWTQMVGEFKYDFVDVKGKGPNHVFALSARGEVLYFDGQKWIAIGSNTNNPTHSIWISDTGKAYISGEGGTIISLEIERK